MDADQRTVTNALFMSSGVVPRHPTEARLAPVFQCGWCTVSRGVPSTTVKVKCRKAAGFQLNCKQRIPTPVLVRTVIYHLRFLTVDMAILSTIFRPGTRSRYPSSIFKHETYFTFQAEFLKVEINLQGNGPIRHVETCPDFFFHCKSTHNKIYCQNFSC
jgi:hypothetical protein